MEKIKKEMVPVVIVVLSFFAMWPLFHSGFFTMHDNEQVGRLFELNKDIVNGHIVPRLAQDLGFGYDYPLFNFYPSLVYYIAEVFHLVGFSYIVSLKIMIGLGFLLAGLAMYWFAKEYLPKIGAIVASIAYIYAPYHSVDLYVRGALPEFWSFVFVPFLFWSFLKLQKTEKYTYVILTGVFVALFILAHDLIAMMSAIFLGIFFMYLFVTSGRKKRFVYKTAASGIIGFLLSAFFWLPAIIEKRYTMVNLLTTQLANYHLHFVCLRQFWNSPWGYGGSILGCNDGLSFQIGKVQLILFLASLLFMIWVYFKTKRIVGIFILFLGMFFLSLFIQINKSVFVWNLLEPFWYIQFPWRFLLFSDFTIAFLAGFIFLFIKSKIWNVIIGALCIGVLIYFNVGYFKPQSYLSVSDKYYTNSYFLRYTTSKMSFEYVPKGIATVTSPIGNTVPDIGISDVAKSDFSVVRGNIEVKVLQSKPQFKAFAVNAKTNGMLQINVFSFPGWKIYLNNTSVKYNANNKLKLLRLNIPQGKYLVDAVFEETPVRKAGDYISLIAASLVFVALLIQLSLK